MQLMSVQTITRQAKQVTLAPVRSIDSLGYRLTTNTQRANDTRTPLVKPAEWFKSHRMNVYSACSEIDSLMSGKLIGKHGFTVRVDSSEGVTSTGHVVVTAYGGNAKFFKKCLVHYSQLTNQKIVR